MGPVCLKTPGCGTRYGAVSSGEKVQPGAFGREFARLGWVDAAPSGELSLRNRWTLPRHPPRPGLTASARTSRARLGEIVSGIEAGRAAADGRGEAARRAPAARGAEQARRREDCQSTSNSTSRHSGKDLSEMAAAWRESQALRRGGVGSRGTSRPTASGRPAGSTWAHAYVEDRDPLTSRKIAKVLEAQALRQGISVDLALFLHRPGVLGSSVEVASQKTPGSGDQPAQTPVQAMSHSPTTASIALPYCQTPSPTPAPLAARKGS